MHRFLTTALLSLTIVAFAGSAAQAQVPYYTPVYYQPAPAYYQPAVVPSYYAPAPVTAYYAPPVATYYIPPVTSYYAPTPAYYAPPAVAYSYYAPAYAPAAVVTTRTYYGYGVFRPRGVYTQSYYTPLYYR